MMMEWFKVNKQILKLDMGKNICEIFNLIKSEF